ncbi:MAG: FAD-binding and (Fe-S)-binding domain-containing protein [Phycisphaerales bacterium]
MNLPVLPSRQASREETARAALAGDLRRLCRGEVRFDQHDRMLYSTDASMYQVEPIGVVTPADTEDARRVIEFCGARSVAVLPRGGGTSLAGQCTAEAVVIDLTPHCRAICSVNADAAECEVEAGLSIDELNADLQRRRTGLFFAPDPATTAQSSIGGNIGNNAAGARSVLYGRTSENLFSVDAALITGERLWLGPGPGIGAGGTALRLSEGVASVTREVEGLIRERFPKTLRQNAGYGLDRMLAQLDAGATPATLDLAQLLAGSEGTLALTLGARLRLRPLPRSKGLALLAFPSVDAAIEAVVPILATGPSAIELVDDVVITAARGNLECSPFVDVFPRLPGSRGDPAAVLYVEYHRSEPAEAVEERFDRLRATVPGAPMRALTDPAIMADAWKLRKAGEPLLHGLPGPRKPLTFIEDNAVPPIHLGRFVRELRAVIEREGTRAAFWAHASVGVLHVRPMLNPHDPGDLSKLRRIATEAAEIARACGGVMSGEHGDGRVRGPLLPRFFGDDLIKAFGRVKALFDPKGLLNPGNIVEPLPIASITERTRIRPLSERPMAHTEHLRTFFDYEREEGFGHAIEQCNGAGVCRKTSGGTMCPSYRATLDERHATRGRANALRLAITGQMGEDRWRDPATEETLALCLSCKACKSECPSNVDVAKLKAEYTAQGYLRAGGVPLRAQFIGRVRLLNTLGSFTPALSNALAASPHFRRIINAVMGIHPRRSLPRFSTSLTRRTREFAASADAHAPKVALFGDCFTTANESDIGVAAGRLLGAFGYRVMLANAGCCGRSMISVGMLAEATETIDATLERLRPLIGDPTVRAVAVVEPSCLSAIKDDWLSLRCRTPLALRKRLAAKAMLVEEFLDREWDHHPLRPIFSISSDPVLLHAHCHQKALWGAESSARMLRRAFGDRLRVLETGCCGMAGSFGFAREKFELSMAIGEMPGSGLLPQVRSAPPEAVVCAPGTSCRHQVHDGCAGRVARHPVELLLDAIVPAPNP